jgi:hypothetical protein
MPMLGATLSATLGLPAQPRAVLVQLLPTTAR